MKHSHSMLQTAPFPWKLVRITTMYAEALGARPWYEAAGSHSWLRRAFSVAWRHWHHEMSGLKMEIAQHCLGPIPGNAFWIEALSLAAPSP